jgi:hypothetical protein
VTERHSWAVGAVAGVGQVNELDARITISGLVAPAGLVTSRGGVFPAADWPGYVSATTPTPNGEVHVAPFRGALQSVRPGGGGTYLVCNDGVVNINVLGTAPANPANDRIDLIVWQQSDTFHGDPDSRLRVRHVVGTPAVTPVDPDPTADGLSPDYILAARITVPANAVTIEQGDIENIDIPYTVSAGGLLPIFNLTERNAIVAPYSGMPIYRVDRDWVEIYDGIGWRVQGIAVCSSTVDRDSAITSPHNGLLAYTADTGITWQRHNNAWRVPYPLGVIGGRVITGLNALGSAISTVETMPTNMNSGPVTLQPNRRYVIRCRYKMQGTVSTDLWVMRLREGASAGTSGNQLRQDVRDTVAVGSGFTYEFEAEYETGAVAVSKVFSLTAVRVNGTGTVTFVGGDAGSTNLVGVVVKDAGPAGVLTATAS